LKNKGFLSAGKEFQMGFFNKLFGSKNDYPEIDPSSPVVNRLEKFKDHIETLSDEAKQPLEVVPGDDRAFVFIGKPPKKFGIAWIEDGQINNLKTLVERDNVEPPKVQALADRLRQIYENNQQTDRFTAHVGKCDVVVTPSDKFRKEVREVISQVTH
jgi:hypothetical protein